MDKGLISFSILKRILIHTFINMGLLSCGGAVNLGGTQINFKKQILQEYNIELLRDEPYIFQARGENGNYFYQKLRRWDIIFTGGLYHAEDHSITLHKLIPGNFLHTFLYLGKDGDGNGYVIELNQYENNENLSDTMSVDLTGSLKIDAGIMIHSIGKDDNISKVKDAYTINFGNKEIYMAKRLNKRFLKKINKNKDAIFGRIKNDLKNNYPYQIPINFDLTKIYIIDDGFKNGSSCTEYIYLLFEKYAKVCLNDIFTSTDEFLNYFKNDPEGKKAYIPAKKNFLTHKDIYLSEFTENGFTFNYKKPYKGFCNPSMKNRGIATPSKLYHSKYLLDI